MANAMVIGIGGVGSVIGQKLHEYDCFDRIVLADMDPVFANQLAAKTPKSRCVVVQANAMQTDELAALMKEHRIDVTCNACVCLTNHSVMEACLRAGSHYIDMAADIYSAPGVKKPRWNTSPRSSAIGCSKSRKLIPIDSDYTVGRTCGTGRRSVGHPQPFGTHQLLQRFEQHRVRADPPLVAELERHARLLARVTHAHGARTWPMRPQDLSKPL